MAPFGGPAGALGRPWGYRGSPEGLLGELKGGQATARRGRNHKKVPERLRVEGLGDQMGPNEWVKEAEEHPTGQQVAHGAGPLGAPSIHETSKPYKA